jgi:hydrogenase maturation protein HypF
MPQTYKITIQGQVQGVGFRPFVFLLATKYKLDGQVFNNEIGVVILLNTSEEKATDFLNELLQNPPKVSSIQNHTIEVIEARKFKGFQIISSEKNQQINLPLTPDFAICEDCKTEIKDPKNRRFQYAFTTCVKCGPRYSITTKFPFERANTALTQFKMCSVCENEYKNPIDRRFHSQTNSCAECGIKMSLEDSSGNIIKENQQEILTKTAQYISEGKIVAIKNTNGYLLCCDANNAETVQLLRERKKRQSKPFALLYPSLELIKKHFYITENEEIALRSSVAPIVILKIKNTVKSVAIETIAPNLNHLGVMLPSSALLQLLVNKIRTPIVATSGNLHGSPIISENKEARKSLKNVADYFVHHNLNIQFPQDDSVVKFVGKEQIILRRSRGLVPNYLDFNKKIIKSQLSLSEAQTQSLNGVEMAMGAHLKSTFSFLPNSNLYVSQYFGNLDNYEVSERFKNTIRQFTDVFEIIPKTILVDSHPQYQSTIIGKELAVEWNADCIEIQHHKAHFASVLAEHNLFSSKEKILGVIWDGTGWGDDDAIWGGEFFMYQNHQMERLAHFEYFDWIVADKFSKEPRLVLLSLISKENRKSIQHKFSETEWNIYLKLLENNSLVTSSVGRLFDAVASLLEITDHNNFEGEAAMRLETMASNYKEENFIDFLKNENYINIPSKKLIENIQKSLSKNTAKEKIAASFIFTLAKSIIHLAKTHNINIIACSGGVFQNSLLVGFLKSLTAKHSLLLKLNRKLSCNDENISFGQLQYYLNTN